MNHRQLPGFYDITDRKGLLEGVRNGKQLSMERMVLGHTRLAARIVNSLAYQWRMLYYRDELDLVAYTAIVIAVNRVQEGRMRHDDFTSYIACYIHGYVKKAIKKARKLFPLEYDKSQCDANLFDTLDTIHSVCKNETERKIVDLRRKGYTDKEVSEVVGLTKGRITQIRHELRTRFNRKVNNE